MKDLIAKRLMELRADRSQEEVTTALGISKSTWSMYENAERIPKDEIKIKIANYFNKTVQEIFFDS